MDSNKIKVEIGPGDKKIGSDWITIGDFERPGIVDHVCNWGKDKIPLASDSVDFIYTSHALEHVPWFQSDFALSECYRVLKIGGLIEIHVPNFEYIVQCYIERKIGDHWIKYNNREHHTTWAASRIFTHGPTFSNYHKSCWDREYLDYCLVKNNFKNITLCDGGKAKEYHGIINLGMRAVK